VHDNVSMYVEDLYGDAPDELKRIVNPAHGIDSVQTEVNKKRFMDTQTFRATASLAKLQAAIDTLPGKVAADTRNRMRQ
jgi:N-formylglutamate amidohydrolase